MTSVAGNKDRSSSVATRNRKYGMTDACSPTKSASFSPETWYRKAYEESRTGSRPTPEGAGSVPGSSGTPSPGSGTSSPGSFSGSPGPTSPGIGTGSPGSLGGSPGFGTGSPGSGSGSSPGSDRGIWCENCNARLVELKRQALKLLIPGPFSSKDPSFSALIHDKLQVPNTTRKAWNEKDNRCDICATHLNQLKQEAIQMVLTLEQAASLEQSDVSPGSPPLSSIPSLVGSRNISGLQGPRDWSYLPAAYSTPGYTGFLPGKHSSKPNSLGIGTGLEKKNGSPGHAGKPGAQMPTSPSNGNILSSVAIQAHQYLEGTWSLSRANGVTLYPYQISQLMTETCREGLTEAALNRYNADRPSLYSFSGSQNTFVSSVPSSGTSAAASFFARAAQKLNLSSKKKKQHRPSPSYVCDPPLFPTNFSGILQISPPPAPPCLLRAVNKVKDNPGLGKVKVMLRVCPLSPGDTSESSSFLKVDPRKKQITLFDPASNGPQKSTQKRGSQVPPKMFAFDAAFPHDASQAEVCAGTVAEVIQSVVNGADGCVFCFGHAKLGKSYTMIGKDDSMQNLGIIPCAISWLFKLINERKEKTGARFSVRVSAVEVWGKDENLKDLLSEVATGSLQDGQSPGVYLCEDPICGMQLQNQSELRAPTAEKAAFFLDAAIASRHSSKPDCDEDEHRNSHMLFTLHIYQYRMEKSGKGGMSGGRSRLHLIDLGSCVKVLSKNRDSSSGLCLSLSALGNVILALVNGSKHIPYKDSKLTMLLRESLGNMNCRTTMIAHISAAPSNFAETLSTIQIASRVLRMKKKKTKYTSSSSGGESSCEEGRMRRPTQLRPFHSRNVVDPELPLLHLSSDPDYSSSSEQSCDTVIYVGPNGSALSDKELTDNEGPPDFVPIIPSLQKNKIEPGKLQQLVQEESADTGKHEKDCLKCNTFAELQERLECIDGSEEVTKFPFEEVPANPGPKYESLLTQGPEIKTASESHVSDKVSNGQQQQQLKEALQNAIVPHTESVLTALPSISTFSSSRSVTGSSNIQTGSLQNAQNSTLYSSKESLNTTSSGEAKPRPMGSPRLGIASLTKTSDYKPPSSPSQRCKVYTQKGVLPCSAPLLSQSMNKDNGKSSSESLLQPEVRTSPVGMSPQVMKKSSSFTSVGSTETSPEDLTQQSVVNRKEVKSTTTVTVQQPLELNGEDELVFTLVEELTISGVMENGRPTSIISFNSDCSVQALASGSRPVSIISSISEDLECYSTAAACTTATISEVSITKFLPVPKRDVEALTSSSRCSSISSWLSEMSTGSDGEQSCHSFVAQQSYGQGEAMADPHLTDLSEDVHNDVHDDSLQHRNGGGESLLAAAEKVHEKSLSNKVSPLKNCKVSTMGKTAITISNVPTLVSDSYIPIKANITVRPCIPVKPGSLQDSNQECSALKSLQIKETKAPAVSVSSDIKFDDPWLKREDNDEPKAKDVISEAKLEKRASDPMRNWNSADRFSSSSGEVANSPVYCDNLKRVVDGCEMALSASESHSPVYSAEVLKTGSLPRGWHRLNKQDDPEESSLRLMGGDCNGIGATTSTPCSPRATLERRGMSAKQCILSRPKGIPPLPPVRKSSLDQRNRASPQHGTGSNQTVNQTLTFIGSTPDDLGSNGKLKGPNVESSSRLFSAKLEQLANRTNSLGRSHAGHYDCLSLERAESLTSVGSKTSLGRDSTMPRTGRSLSRGSVSSPTGSNGNNSTPQSPKSTQSKISAVSKLLLASPKARSLSASSTKTLSFSTKSLPQSVNRSSSLPPNGKNQISWSTQSLSRNRGSGLASKLPLRAVNGRISELLQGSSGSRSGHARGASDSDERAMPGDEKPVVQTLPSPYSKITAPRKPHRCSSGHGSDNSSVLSGELPPAMGKTALFYHSGGSSGYESMIRDSEATGSASSAQDSMSENSSSVSGRRSLKNPKKRNNTGSQRRRLIPALTLDTSSPVGKPTPSPGLRWVDGPLRPAQRGMAEPFEIKVYEIDDVERLQRRRGAGSREVVYFSAKLKILEHRQQRISEVRAKYDWLKKELEVTKQHLMLEPEKWTSEFDLQQTFEVDSLEYLEALEFVTERLESRVNFCKAHLMMITCFDITSRRR
ncbi:kinesin-like protein KIF26B isoform X2 [Lepisosteus oculatus]|uniref:kinesin-like protein KIF26B isoform X2 n=1 Tax=Lepisosteus oculatus TaxID=7918 RepID=UPI0003EA8298|nr:PREDICTED: kinesin-like protein KIF26B isoform X2 [Lepisosteus oculatus]